MVSLPLRSKEGDGGLAWSAGSVALAGEANVRESIGGESFSVVVKLGDRGSAGAMCIKNAKLDTGAYPPLPATAGITLDGIPDAAAAVGGKERICGIADARGCACIAGPVPSATGGCAQDTALRVGFGSLCGVAALVIQTSPILGTSLLLIVDWLTSEGSDFGGVGLTGPTFDAAGSDACRSGQPGCGNLEIFVPAGSALDAASTPRSPTDLVADAGFFASVTSGPGCARAGDTGCPLGGLLAWPEFLKFPAAGVLLVGSVPLAARGAVAEGNSSWPFSEFFSPRIPPNKDRNISPPSGSVPLVSGWDFFALSAASVAPGAVCSASM